MKASNKQEVHPLMKYHKLTNKLMMFAMGNVFFKEINVESQSFCSLLMQMEQYKSTFKAIECLDKEFPSKFFLVLDMHYELG
jgi:hypothetical protein